MELRFAVPSDSRALLEIYAQSIHTPVTFECELPSEAEFASRIAEVSEEYPYLVCESGGKAVGYAYAHRAQARAAYRWNAELSVYLDREVVSRGLGGRLYRTLIALLGAQGIKTVYGVVTLPNEKSERLHEKLGFRRLGVYRNAGYKSGAWHDVVWFEKAIAPYERDPEPPVSIRAMGGEAERILREEWARPC